MMWYRVWGVSIALISTIQATHSAYLRCFCDGSLENYQEVSLENSTELIESQCLNITRRTLIYTFGYLGKVAGPTTNKVMTAYVTKNDRNVCLMNWEKEANSGMIPLINYPLVVEVSQKIAEIFANAILALYKAGMSLATLQLAGLSLGAHLCGYTGRRLVAAGAVVGEIIGLDPAYPEYDGAVLDIKKPLGKSDAKFVYIIHTDCGRYGMRTATANIDFFPNFGFYENGTNRQPGCSSEPSMPFSEQDLCSHNRAAELWVDSLLYPMQLQASTAKSYDDWGQNRGEPKNVTCIGDMINQEYEGLYYLTTNGQSPFGKGVAGLEP